MIWRTFFLVAMLAVLGVLSASADGARVFDNAANWANPEEVTVSEEDLFPNPPYMQDWQSRSFFFLGRLDDGTFFAINPFHWQFGQIKSWGLLVLVTDSTGHLYRFDGNMPPQDRGDPRRGFDHRFGDDMFKSAGSEHRVRLKLDGFSCDLLIENILPAWKPGDGWAYYDRTGSAYSHYAVPAPLAEVSGTMNVFGKEQSVHGMCTWDSSLSVQPLGRPNSPVYSLRVFDSPSAPQDDRLFVDVVESFMDKGYGGGAISLLYVSRGTTCLFTTQDFTLDPSDWRTATGLPYPSPGRYSLKATGRGWELEGQFMNSRIYNVTDVFQKIPPLIRELVSLFLKRPVLYDMVGEFRGQLVSPDGDVQSFSLPAHGEYIVVK